MSKDIGLNFEYAVRQFLGNAAHGIAGMAQDKKSFRRELRGCVPVMKKRIDMLDTTTRHKEMLMGNVEKLSELLKQRKGGTDEEIIVELFWLVSRLFGFDAISGRIYNQPFYHQYFSQFIDEQVAWGKKDFGAAHKENKNNIITLRKETYHYLANRGLPDQVIAGIMNTSEYNIKKLKHDI